MKKLILLALGLFLCLVHVAGAVPHSSISSTIHTHHHLFTLSHILNQTTWLTELLEGRRAPQEITPGIQIDPTADPGLTVFAPTNSAFDAVAHLSHVDLLYHILPISLSLQPVNNYTTTYWVHSLSSRHGDAQFGVGQVLQVVVLPHRHAESSAYIIFGTPYSPHNIARVISSIPCSNGMLHVIDTVLSLPEMTSHVMKQLSESYQHRDNIEMLLKQREQYQKQAEKEKHNKKEKDGKDGKDEQDVHHHDRVIRHGILKYDQLMKDYGFMRTVDRFRGITLFVPASTIESNLEHYSSNTLSVALLHHIIPGPPIYSFAALLDGAMTRTIILQGISGSTTLTIQRRSGFTPAMDTTDAITVMLNGHVVNPIPSITRNGVIYVVDSCLPDTQTTADSCTDIDPPIPAATVITVDSQSQHDLEERLREMRQQIHEREKEMKQREREMKHDFKEREHELLKQYEERQHERTRGNGEQQEQREQREQPQQPQQPQQQYGDYTHYIPDYTKFIPGYQGKQQPTSEPSSPHIIHIGVGHDKDVSIVIGSDGLIITKEYKHGCEPEDKECREKYDQEKEECECESEDDKCRDECDAKAEEKEIEREKQREHAYEKEKEKERQHENEREHDNHRERKDEAEEKEREHEKEKECECQPSDDTCHEECDKKAHAHAHAHDDSGHERDEKEHDHDHDKHQDKKHECDKDECDEQEKSTHEKKHEKDQHGRDDKHTDKHHDKHDEKHDKHDTRDKHDDKHDNKHDIKSTSDAAVMQIVPELDPSVYDDANDHEEQSQQHHSWTQWTMILTIGILGGLVLVCAAAGYCCIHFQSRSDHPSAMGEYAAASETTGLLSKPVVPPVRDDVVSRPCCNDPTTNPTCHHDPNPIPVPPQHHKHLHLNGYQHSPNGCTHPILNDHHGISGSDVESERYMESHGTTSNGHIPNGHIKSNQGKSKGKGKGSGKSNGTNHENQCVPRSDAVNIHT